MCEAKPYLGLRKTVTMATFASAIDLGFPELFEWLETHGVETIEAPFVRYYVVDIAAELEIELGVPVHSEVKSDDRVQHAQLPAGEYVTMLHVGPYDGLYEPGGAF